MARSLEERFQAARAMMTNWQHTRFSRDATGLSRHDLADVKRRVELAEKWARTLRRPQEEVSVS